MPSPLDPARIMRDLQTPPQTITVAAALPDFPLPLLAPLTDAIRDAATRRAFAGIYYLHGAKEQNWCHLARSAELCARYGERPITRVTVCETDDAEPDAFAWLDYRRGTLSMLWSDRRFVEMCSPDGFVTNIKLGDGRLVRLRIVPTIAPSSSAT